MAHRVSASQKNLGDVGVDLVIGELIGLKQVCNETVAALSHWCSIRYLLHLFVYVEARC